MIQKPYGISLKSTTIDANENNTIKWKVSGAMQSAYSLEIRKNSDNTIVISVPKTNSYANQHVLASGTLINGNEYKITITVFDELNSSATSDPDIFQTSSKPIVTLSPIGTVTNFSYNFQATYTQDESVGLKSYIAFLYDENQRLITNSNIKTMQPIEHIFSDLESETNYFVEFQATSNKGLTGTSGLIGFNVLYTQPSVSVNLTAKNIENAGIELSWNVIQIILKAEGTTPYLDNEKIDLSLGRVYADEGFRIDENFTLSLWLESPIVSSFLNQTNLLKIKGTNGEIVLQYWDDNRFKIWKTINGYKSLWVSTPVTGSAFFVGIKQIGDNCDVIAESLV